MKIEELKKNDLIYCECDIEGGAGNKICKCIAKVCGSQYHNRLIDIDVIDLHIYRSNFNTSKVCELSDNYMDKNFWII